MNSGRGLLAAVAIALIVAALVWITQRSSMPQADEPQASSEIASADPPAIDVTADLPTVEERALDERGRDLAIKLSRIFDGGIPGASALPSPSVQAPPPSSERDTRPPSSVTWRSPATIDDQLAAGGQLLDMLTLRRDDLRAELEAARQANNQDRIATLEALIGRIDEAEPAARRRVEDLARRAAAIHAREGTQAP